MLTDAELITLAIAQVFLDCPSERRFLRFARQRLGHLFPYLPGQPAYNRRLRKLAPAICAGDRPLGAQLAVVRRPAQAAGLHAGAVRRLARDGQALRAGRLCRLRLLRQPLALLLGPAAVSARARPMGCRSRSVWHPPTSPSARSPPPCSTAPPAPSCCTAKRSTSPTKGSPAPIRAVHPRRARPQLIRPDRRDEPRRSAHSAHPPVDRIDQRHPQGPVLARTPRRPHPRRRLDPRLPTRTRARRRLLAQLAHRQPGRSFTAYDH